MEKDKCDYDTCAGKCCYNCKHISFRGVVICDIWRDIVLYEVGLCSKFESRYSDRTKKENGIK